MLLRPLSRVLPHTIADIGCFLLLFTFIPITFIFELAVVVPELHDIGSFFYIFTWLAGLFLVFNLKANILACMLVDTSIRTELLTPPLQSTLRKQWHMCDDCQTLVPPRSWHCPVCATCVLKRDHHCMFTGCCIGHHNHRYFFYFIIYLCIGSAYTSVYNSYYFWYLHGDIYCNWRTALKLVFPMFMCILDVSRPNFYLLIYELNLIAFAYTIVLIIHHGKVIRNGAVSYERKAPIYDLGWKRNLEMVLGKRMHLTWLSPFIRSDLPHNGVNWEALKAR